MSLVVCSNLMNCVVGGSMFDLFWAVVCRISVIAEAQYPGALFMLALILIYFAWLSMQKKAAEISKDTKVAKWPVLRLAWSIAAVVVAAAALLTAGIRFVKGDVTIDSCHGDIRHEAIYRSLHVPKDATTFDFCHAEYSSVEFRRSITTPKHQGAVIPKNWRSLFLREQRCGASFPQADLAVSDPAMEIDRDPSAPTLKSYPCDSGVTGYAIEFLHLTQDQYPSDTRIEQSYRASNASLPNGCEGTEPLDKLGLMELRYQVQVGYRISAKVDFRDIPNCRTMFSSWSNVDGQVHGSAAPVVYVSRIGERPMLFNAPGSPARGLGLYQSQPLDCVFEFQTRMPATEQLDISVVWMPSDPSLLALKGWRCDRTQANCRPPPPPPPGPSCLGNVPLLVGPDVMGRTDIVVCGASDRTAAMPPSLADAKTLCAASWHLCTAGEFVSRSTAINTELIDFSATIDDGEDCAVVNQRQQSAHKANIPYARTGNDGTPGTDRAGTCSLKRSGQHWGLHRRPECKSFGSNCGALCCK